MPDKSASPDNAGSALSARRSPLRTATHVVGDRTTAAPTGDIDFSSERAFHLALSAALEGSVSGVDLDLSAVGFCDCSSLNVVLRMRRRALADGKTLVVRATSPAVERLLALTGTRDLLTDRPRDDTDEPHTARFTAPRSDVSALPVSSPLRKDDLVEVDDVERPGEPPGGTARP
ncbi:STAS domain-containing protein [Streptomyces sp. NPDC002580]|uniref:STAS domain-containing protein n=1 Tax=Streptomyces sp. NPDC002580 TaxID=3364653 RepID=UPI003687A71A